MDEFRVENLRNWESRVPVHAGRGLHWFSEETYTDGPAVAEPGHYEWNHGLAEIVQGVIDAGLTVTTLREHREREWPAFPHLVQGPDGKFRLAHGQDRLPLMFTLEARR